MIMEEETFEKFGYYPSELTSKSSKPIFASCDDCGKIRVTTKHDYRAFCKSCAVKGERGPMYGTSRKGEDNPNWKGGKVRRICEYCGTEFPAKPSDIKKGWGRFCSKSCAHKHYKPPKHHTKPERIFESICEKYNLPFKYTGDGSFWIHNINPDFVECNGKKVAVEIFGDYWHSPLLRYNIPYQRTYEGRKKILKKYGWALIVLWESDLKRKDTEAFVLTALKREGAV